MENALRNELNSCISELLNISSELENVSKDLHSAIIGMSLFRYTWTLEDCARKYRNAATRLSNIH